MTIDADVAYLDVADPSFSTRSEAVSAAREANWYARTPYGVAVLRYAEVSQLVRDRRLGQGSRQWPEHNGVSGPFADWWRRSLINLVGEDHARQRRLLNPAFSPRLIRDLAPDFATLANELIDGFAPGGSCEFMGDFAEPYAARVIARLIGIDEGEWKTIATWSTTMGLSLGVTFRDDLARIEEALAGLLAYADAVVEAREHDPGDDFISRLVAHRDDGMLSDLELRETIVNLIFGGMDTTRNQLGLAMHTFVEHPEQWRLLGERPELASAAVEEVIRVRPVTTWVTREALEDFSFQGLEIARGQTVHLFAGAAGTDPRAVPDASFDITAERPVHFAFGGGTHHCIGHFLARRDIAEALVLLAHRLREPTLGGEVTWLPDSGNTGPTSLPLRFLPEAEA
jgi:cytochrome P450